MRTFLFGAYSTAKGARTSQLSGLFLPQRIEEMFSADGMQEGTPVAIVGEAEIFWGDFADALGHVDEYEAEFVCERAETRADVFLLRRGGLDEDDAAGLVGAEIVSKVA